jgi:hypothetical protein
MANRRLWETHRYLKNNEEKMSFEKHLKELLIHQIKQKLKKLNQDIEPLPQPPPDLKILSYGIIIGFIDIITEKEITTDRIDKWKELISQGNKLIIILPKEEKLKIIDTLWKEGLAEKKTYEINLFFH